MCGITGIIALSESGRSQIAKLEQSTDALSHRGPDHAGHFYHGDVGLGHRRLSVIDTSDAGNQPMTDNSGRYTIVFNGEFYNYREQRALLEKKGFVFNSASDTEVLLQLYLHEGPDFLEKVNGFFALAIYDKQADTLFIARDRMGIKPLYYAQDDSVFLFASEMKGILAFDWSRKIDQTALFTYLQLNYIPAPQTMLMGVHKLLPGHYLFITGCQQSNTTPFEVTEKRFYIIPYDRSNNAPLNPTAYEEQCKVLVSLMEESVGARLVSDVPLGTFLSGGIDSSVITAIAAGQVDKLSTFSIGYKDQPFFDETSYAELVAKKYKTNHTTFKLTGDDFLEHLPSILDSFDEPFADASAIAVYILCHLTRQHVTVALSGDGADEMFSGYHKHAAEFRVRNPGVVESMVKQLGPVWKKMPGSRDSKLGNLSRQLGKFSEGMKLGPKERYWKWASFLTEESANYLLREKLVFKEQRLSDTAHRYKKRKETFLKLLDKPGNIGDVLYADMHLVLPNDMLAKVDKMSMANSLEVRTPFLDQAVVEFAFSLPDAYKINGQMRKKILQDSFRNRLPEELFNRPKQGFEVPLLQWFKTELAGLIKNDLLEDKFVEEQGIFNVKAVKELKTQLFSSQPSDAATTTWALLVFQHWWKKHLQ